MRFRHNHATLSNPEHSLVSHQISGHILVAGLSFFYIVVSPSIRQEPTPVRVMGFRFYPGPL
jgi:hypothetical protein